MRHERAFSFGEKRHLSVTNRIKTRIWWPNLELNQGHADFQSAALPTELFGHFDDVAAVLNQNRSGSNEGVFNRLDAPESSYLTHFWRLFYSQDAAYGGGQGE